MADNDQAKKFGVWIKSARSSQGMTLGQLELQTGYSKGNISRLEKGLASSVPKKDTIIKLAEALKQNVDEALAIAGRLGSDEIKDLNDTAKTLSPAQLRVAAHINDDVTPAQLEDITRYIEFRKSQG
ncbi:XRE family transcriptional regulator [Periweissella cryptocerci]|uniref:XRE family transcriptional regulator n=1 Tax=Periweissella cryptocerci TaxID=2506420 RepID=A0A4P6YRX5_9LACO|nr:helix-turn-helix transcriptional regulator [Periweissella cryptocerci]QBO35417.1 XRE family transcriptional regulator [Periweissella cryptocerci]